MSCVIGQLTCDKATVARNSENSQTVWKQELYCGKEIALIWTGSIKYCTATRRLHCTALLLTFFFFFFFYYSTLQKISVKNCAGHKTRDTL